PLLRSPPLSTLFPYTTLFRSLLGGFLDRHPLVVAQLPGGAADAVDAEGHPVGVVGDQGDVVIAGRHGAGLRGFRVAVAGHGPRLDRKSTRLNSSHLVISYAVF